MSAQNEYEERQAYVARVGLCLISSMSKFLLESKRIAIEGFGRRRVRLVEGRHRKLKHSIPPIVTFWAIFRKEVLSIRARRPGFYNFLTTARPGFLYVSTVQV